MTHLPSGHVSAESSVGSDSIDLADIDSSDESPLKGHNPSLSSLPSSLTPDIKDYHGRRYALVYEGESQQRIRAGEAPVILAPGVPSTERDFRHLAPLIYTWAPVARIVWPGFGVLHDEEEPPASTSERAQYLSMIAAAEGWKAHVIVGHSLGGVAALAHAVQDERVIGLYLISSVGVRRHRGMMIGPRGARLHLALFKIPGLRRVLRSISARLMTRVGFVGHPFHLRQIILIFRHVQELSFKENQNNIKRLSSTPSLPIGVVTTADDPIIDARASEALVHAICAISPHLSHLHLECGGHNPQRHCTIEIDRWLRARYSESLAWLDLHPLPSILSEDEPKDSPSLHPEESL